MKLISGEKYLVDTNVLVYSVNRDSSLYQASIEVLQEALAQGASLVLTHQNLLEFIAVLTRAYHVSFQQALEDAKAFGSSFEVIIPLPATFDLSMDLMQKTRGTLYPFDLYLAATMMNNDVFRIITANKKDFQGIGLEEVIEIS